MKIDLKMNPSKRLHYMLLVSVGLLLIGLAAGAYGANSLLTSRAGKLTALKAKSLAQAQEQTSFINAKKEIEKYADLQKITQAVVPADKDQAQAVREIVNIAAANGVNLASITFPASTLGAGVAGSTSSGGTPAQAAPAQAPSGGSSKTGSSANSGKLSQLAAVKNIPGVYSLLITVQSDSNKPVPYYSFLSFLSALEHNRRTAQISTITLQPKPTNRNLLTFTLTLNEYIKP